jgi:putative redox protein
MANITAHIGRTHYVTTIRNASNELIADEPLEQGGTDAGFSSSELLASSLAACTSITLRMYADRKGWPLEAIEVAINFERDVDTKTSLFVRNIKFFGTLDDEQTQRLLQIADKCPIHQVLTSPIRIQTVLT